MEKGDVLTERSDFDRAMDQQISIIVWKNGKIVNYGGPIQMQTDDVVIINDVKYSKLIFEFRVR